jgi:hypothetical protein
MSKKYNELGHDIITFLSLMSLSVLIIATVVLVILVITQGSDGIREFCQKLGV